MSKASEKDYDTALELVADAALKAVKLVGVEQAVTAMMYTATMIARHSGEMQPQQFLDLIEGLGKAAVKIETRSRQGKLQ